jgi:hypothetical protein
MMMTGGGGEGGGMYHMDVQALELRILKHHISIHVST